LVPRSLQPLGVDLAGSLVRGRTADPGDGAERQERRAAGRRGPVGRRVVAFQEKTYWLDTVEIPKPASHPLPERVDVAVVGAGFTGLSAARTLAKLGASTVVLEAESVGWGASSRNGGMVLPGLKLGVSTLISRYGLEATRAMYAASLASIDCVEKI